MFVLAQREVWKDVPTDNTGYLWEIPYFIS